MPSPFPGMDPYLEEPAVWPGVHNLLIAALCFDLAPRLRPRYYVAVEERVYISHAAAAETLGVPDLMVSARRDEPVLPAGTNGWGTHSGAAGDGTGVAIMTVELPLPQRVRETYLEVRTPGDHEVVTVVELLSPTNKRPGEGRRQYEAKRQAVLDSLVNFVEVDLLRGGDRLPVWRDGMPSTAVPGDYAVLVTRRHERPRAELRAFTVRDPIPPFPCPLRPEDAEPMIDLQSLLAMVYEQGAYELRLDYTAPPVPPLAPQDAEWASNLLTAGL